VQRVLIVYYSNTGSTEALLRKLTHHLELDPDISLTWLRLRPAREYPFPWTLSALFDTAPETVGETPLELSQPGADELGDFDLIILGWQVWWLRPSAPVTAFVRSQSGRVLRGARVVLVGCSRQMWRSALARLRAALADAGALCGDSIMVRHEGSGATLVTTPLMLLTGRRAWPAFLPQPVLRTQEVEAAGACGRRLAEAKHLWNGPETPSLLGELAPGSFDRAYLAPEAVASLYMSLWRPVFSRLPRRGGWVRGLVVGAWAVGFVIGVVTVVPGWWLIYASLGWLAAPGSGGERPGLRGAVANRPVGGTGS